MSFALVYSSTAVGPFSRDELEQILVVSRRNNSRRDVTGMLLYRDRRIMQFLEGDESVVRDLFTTIGTDPRHRDVVPLWADDDRTARLFPDWSMSFRDLASGPVSLDGYSSLMDEAATVEDALRTRTVGEELLTLFRRAA